VHPVRPGIAQPVSRSAFSRHHQPGVHAAYNEVKRLGGDGVITQTARTPDQRTREFSGLMTGPPSLCAPPRLYNQITVHIADQMGTDGIELARLPGLGDVAMADAGIAIWESKYYYDIWRPIHWHPRVRPRHRPDWRR